MPLIRTTGRGKNLSGELGPQGEPAGRDNIWPSA